MGLADVITAVQDKLVERGYAEEIFKLGLEHALAHGSPPRIVWAPARRGETIGPAVKLGANPRSLRTRNAVFEAHIWGEDLDATETMLNDVVAAVHAVIYGNYQASGVEWFGKDGALVVHGWVAVVSFTVEIPITAPAKTTATIQTTAHTTAIENP